MALVNKEEKMFQQKLVLPYILEERYSVAHLFQKSRLVSIRKFVLNIESKKMNVMN